MLEIAGDLRTVPGSSCPKVRLDQAAFIEEVEFVFREAVRAGDDDRANAFGRLSNVLAEETGPLISLSSTSTTAPCTYALEAMVELDVTLRR